MNLNNNTTFEKPDILYKYVSCEGAEKILSTNSLRFSSPISFNDPFDCDIDLLYFDMSDCSSDVQREISILRKQFHEHELTEDLISRAYKNSKIDNLNKASVTCFSVHNNNVLMWSHYANKHEGVCLRFNNLLNRRFPKFGENELSEGYVAYGFKQPYNYLKDKKEGLKQLFATKALGWEYEQEYRMFWLKQQDNYEFTKPFLTGIFFGLKTSDQEVERLMSICASNKYEISFYKSHKKNFSINFGEYG